MSDSESKILGANKILLLYLSYNFKLSNFRKKNKLVNFSSKKAILNIF